MTETKELRRLKALAKRYARANRIAQYQALDLVAGELGFPNWAKLVTRSKTGWQPDPEQMMCIEEFVEHPLPTAVFRERDREAMSRRFALLEQGDQGMIGNHAYRLHDVLDDVIMAGEGWSIRVPESPSAIPIVETYTDDKSCPVLDPEFLQTALSLARKRALHVRAYISSDWPRRSTKPDLRGVVRHPLYHNESDVWFCLHCDSKITGAQIARNLWHCPSCGASPIDIFNTAFWSDDAGKSFLPLEAEGRPQPVEPEYLIVDGRPKLDLTEDRIVLLVRNALLDDAANVSERLGALRAEISVDEDDDLLIALDVDLWPEDKEPIEALAVAELLGLEVELVSRWATLPFAWPGLGEITTSTSEYTRMMLDAYAQYDGLQKRKPRTADSA